MKILVYVEGQTEQKALKALLQHLLHDGRRRGIDIRILHRSTPRSFLADVPRLAAEFLGQAPQGWIFALPSLSNIAKAAELPTSLAKIKQRLLDDFDKHAEQLEVPAEHHHRFRVHGLVPEFETLLLAAPEVLRDELNAAESLEGAWRLPVEEQDEDRPPKEIIQALFQTHLGRTYNAVADAPRILERASLDRITAACPRYFKPFVVELRTLLEGGELAREPSGVIEGFMYIHEISIENVRGFGAGERGVKLDLRRPDGSFAGWTVIAGRNGTGKSTLLRAVALAVAGPDTARALHSNYASWIHKTGSDEDEEKSCTVALKLACGERDQRSDAQPHPSKEIRLGLHWEGLRSGAQPKMRPLPGLPQEDKEAAHEGPWAENPAGWFIAGYGPYRRLGPVLQDDTEPGPLMEARLASLFNDEVHLAEALQWLGKIYAERLRLLDQAEVLERQGAVPIAQHNRIIARILEKLQTSVLKLLDEDLLPDNSRVIEFDGKDLWIDQRGLRLPLREFSDGFRTVTALVVDIVRQLDRCFGCLLVDESAGFPQVLHEGVVLIDEIESHMHISWQQRIGFWLKRHFPNIQFIVTTHSPFICQAADPKGLIRLAAPGEEQAAEHVSEELFRTVVNGGADEAAMTALFGLERPHSEQAEALRERVAELEARVLRRQASAEEQEELERLSSQLPRTGSAMVEQALRKLEMLR